MERLTKRIDGRLVFPNELGLPDCMGEVLVIVSGKPHENITLDGAYEIAEYDPVEGWILEMWPEWESAVVTRWMPFPDPPEEEQKK